MTSKQEASASWPADPSNYTLLGKVGQGAFASVWRAQCQCSASSELDAGSGGEGDDDDGKESAANADVNVDVTAGQRRRRFCAIKIMDLEHVDTNFVGEKAGSLFVCLFCPSWNMFMILVLGVWLLDRMHLSILFCSLGSLSATFTTLMDFFKKTLS